MESFQQMVPQRAKVLRDSERKELLATELVVGDIVLLEIGDRVPADIRILECQGEVCPATVSSDFFLSLDGKKQVFLFALIRVHDWLATISRIVSSIESPEKNYVEKKHKCRIIYTDTSLKRIQNRNYKI